MFEAAEREAIMLQEECSSRAEFYGEGADDAAVELYDRAYVNKKGRPGVTYYAKVTVPGDRKPGFHKSFYSAAERDAGVQAFLATRAPVDAGVPF